MFVHPWKQYLTRLRKKLRQWHFVSSKRRQFQLFCLPLLSEKEGIEHDDKSYDMLHCVSVKERNIMIHCDIIKCS